MNKILVSASCALFALIGCAAHQSQSTHHNSNNSDTITVAGKTYDIADDARPSCWMEPSATPSGFEVIYYPHLSMVAAQPLGFEIVCP